MGVIFHQMILDIFSAQLSHKLKKELLSSFVCSPVRAHLSPSESIRAHPSPSEPVRVHKRALVRYKYPISALLLMSSALWLVLVSCSFRVSELRVCLYVRFATQCDFTSLFVCQMNDSVQLYHVGC